MMTEEELAFEQTKWDQEIIWRQREIDIKACELKLKKEEKSRLYIAWMLTLVGVLGSIFGTYEVASTNRLTAEINAKSVANSAFSAAESAKNTATTMSQNALAVAKENGSAAIASVDRNARATKLSVESQWLRSAEDEKRRMLREAVTDYVRALTKAVTNLQTITSYYSQMGVALTKNKFSSLI